MINRERKGKITDSTLYIHWYGHHDGKYYNRSDPTYKNNIKTLSAEKVNRKQEKEYLCHNCGKYKRVSLMCYAVKDEWTCNICALAIQREKMRLARKKGK